MTGTTKYSHLNAEAVLDQVEDYIRALEQAQDTHQLIGEAMHWKGYGWKPVYKISGVCNGLSIFDWWNEDLSISQLKKMEEFLHKAIELGYTGYVCFKVGAAGCSHGMWASKVESTDGYSPDGETLFRGFRNGDYNSWDACLADGTWLHEIVTETDTFTLKQVKNMLKGVQA